MAVLVNGARFVARVQQSGDALHVSVNGTVSQPSEFVEAGDMLIAIRNGKQTSVKLAESSSADLGRASGNGAIAAPMHGRVLSVSVAKGDKVAKGQRLMVLEAMKMEHALDAATDGIVAELSVAAGDQVSEGAQLILIEARKPAAKPAN